MNFPWTNFKSSESYIVNFLVSNAIPLCIFQNDFNFSNATSSWTNFEHIDEPQFFIFKQKSVFLKPFCSHPYFTTSSQLKYCFSILYVLDTGENKDGWWTTQHGAQTMIIHIHESSHNAINSVVWLRKYTISYVRCPGFVFGFSSATNQQIVIKINLQCKNIEIW